MIDLPYKQKKRRYDGVTYLKYLYSLRALEDIRITKKLGILESHENQQMKGSHYMALQRNCRV
ncbi:hypothetical protein M8C21_031263 [Ambrosia artemisiifolia]|uniref:Uncharacterized protein n=1 Tax=Ambrosia artemisiifolia TaxID=4212 RepID=A0AAD5GNX7_AMBAR|nr:hypothetical protein M8C21_031263 [Ambrosia artemisiifolia]